MSTATALFDRFMRSTVDRVTALGPPPPTRMLAPLRAAAMTEVAAAHRTRADALVACIAAGDAMARTELAALADDALTDMRADVQARARRRGPLAALVAIGDAHWGDCDQDELLDDPDLDPTLRLGIMTSLDEFNDILASYARFLDAMLPVMRPTGTTRVLDLAAGHGGFALAATREGRRRGMDIHFTASDLKREYLDMGQAIAERDGLDVDFVVQDALDLSNLAGDAFDVIVCTQSLHHFPAGLISVMFEAATRAATRGVVFTDACRSPLAAALIATAGRMRMRNRGFVHDGWISTRKAFVPEELALLARIGRSTGQLESAWMPPGHCLLRWTP